MVDSTRDPNRRRFLSMTSSAALMAALPWPARAAPSPLHLREAAPANSSIAKLRIYPAIGISRVGGSEKWYYAPEVPGLAPIAEGGFKDGGEKIKKQVQRFRIYAFDDQDRVIGEIADSNGADGGSAITWSVHLANTKAAWYGFSNALDNGEIAPGLPGRKRNQYMVSERQRTANLIIDGGQIDIGGARVNWSGQDSSKAFSGTFWGSQSVGLGQVRTDEEGRLLVVPADGISASPAGAPITSFSDNDGWHDDWSDGPVSASVRLPDGTQMEAEPAWIACVGPNFAPEIPPITTLYDVIENMNVAEGWSSEPEGPLSFRTFIYPTLRRVALMEWLTLAANLRQGWMEIGDLTDPDYLRRLADPSPDNADFRAEVFSLFRDPNNLGRNAYTEEQLKIPYMLGDGVDYNGSPLQWFQFPKLQYSYLERWAVGDFIDDYDGRAPTDPETEVTSLDDLPVEQQPHALTEAALEPCSGGAFHPGVELSYYLRLKDMYARARDPDAEPFRLALGDRPALTQDVGQLLTPQKALEGAGDVGPPVGPQMPGDLTRWMGLPWQCDVFSCQHVDLQQDFPTAVWWPALIPIDVLPEAYYAAAMNPDLPDAERVKLFNSRVKWSRDVAGIGYHASASYWDGITNVIALWERLGFVVRRPGPQDAEGLPDIPSQVFVEVGHLGNMEMRFNWTPEDGMLPN